VLLAAFAGRAGAAAPGSPDPAFGDGGVARAAFAGLDAELTAIALTPGGGVVAVGRVATPDRAPDGAGELAVVRFTPAGRLDGAFGEGGVVVTRVTGEDRPLHAFVQPDGRILVVAVAGYLPHYEFGKGPVRVLRYTREGRLDLSYGGGDGIAELPGRWTVSGAVLAGGRVVLLVNPWNAPEDYPVLRLLALARDGGVDERFGRRGIARTGIRPTTSAEWPALAAAPAGGLVAAGTTGDDRGVFIARYNRRGRLLRRFAPPPLCPSAVTAGADGSVVVAGPRWCAASGRAMRIVRFAAAGTREGAFGDDGIVTLPLVTDNDAAVQDLHLHVLPTGRILVAGLPIRSMRIPLEGAVYFASENPEVSVFRLTRTGRRDPTFAPDGESRFDVSPGTALETSLAGLELRADGRILVGAAPQPPLPIIATEPRELRVVALLGGRGRADEAAATVSVPSDPECGGSAGAPCVVAVGDVIRLAGTVRPAGLPVTVRLFGAYTKTEDEAVGVAFDEFTAAPDAAGRFSLEIATTPDWYAAPILVEAHVAATPATHDARSRPLYLRLRG
jgi:uncharacterized delta-60 repeat protein